MTKPSYKVSHRLKDGIIVTSEYNINKKLAIALFILSDTIACSSMSHHYLTELINI